MRGYSANTGGYKARAYLSTLQAHKTLQSIAFCDFPIVLAHLVFHASHISSCAHLSFIFPSDLPCLTCPYCRKLDF